jgi:hypothetical protein
MNNFRIKVFIFIALIFFKTGLHIYCTNLFLFLEAVKLLDTNYLKLHPFVHGNSMLLFVFLVTKL